MAIFILRKVVILLALIIPTTIHANDHERPIKQKKIAISCHHKDGLLKEAFLIDYIKYAFFLGGWKYEPLERYETEKYNVYSVASCTELQIDNPGGEKNLIGWTTANERLVRGHIQCPGCRNSKKINLDNFTLKVHFYGYMRLNGSFDLEEDSPSTFKNNKNTYQCKLIKDWDEFLKNTRDVVC